MNYNICLVRPVLEMKEEALAYREEHFAEGEYVICGSELFDKTESYEEWLDSVTRNTSPEKRICHRDAFGDSSSSAGGGNGGNLYFRGKR